ncbi:hypothetical protein evm_012051 [Chilo suppressalis]|nr:hypothetical protein evm_012051 [Chilo suppressalis]
MGSVNVNRNVADAFYRYKMPRICAKVEGKGNGIKTVIVNMPEVAKALGRPATYPTKYFGCELGAQTQFDFKNERFIVNGSHDSAKLQDLLDGFIRKFVLCPECDNPETDLIVSTKRNTISQGCKACGYHGQLEFNHKLNTFILKNPPANDPAVQGSSLTEGNRGKRSKRSGPGANGNHDSHDGTDAKNAEGETPAPAAPKPRKDRERKTDDDDDGTWTVDVSEAAVRARMQVKTPADDLRGRVLLYDLDIVEEKAILEWAAKPSRKYASKETTADVLRRAQPFIDWLKDADEEESSENESGEDIEIEYDDRAKATPIKSAVTAPARPAHEPDDDLDIDAI